MGSLLLCALQDGHWWSDSNIRYLPGEPLLRMLESKDH